MKFTDLRIEGFGIWTGLELPALSSGLNVYYGPNEAGKTTILEFTRGMLYGFTPDRRSRYLPPLRSSLGGGTLGIQTAGGGYRITRMDRSEFPLGDVSLVGPHGTTDSEAQLRELLGEVDEPIFRNVFAVGLDELQAIRSLDGASAARLLYDLSTGLDRVSLADVSRELETSRSRLLATDERPSQITDLITQRDKLTAELDELGTLTRRHWHLAGDRERLAEAIARAEAELTDIERQSKLVELAIAVADRWQARAALNEQLATHLPSGAFPPDAIARMQQIKSRRAAAELRLKKIVRRRRRLRDEIAAIEINESLWKHAPRIQALAENEAWIGTAEQQVRDAQAAVDELEALHKANGHVATNGGGPINAVPSPTAKTADSKSDKLLAATSREAASAHVAHRTLVALRKPAVELRRATRAAKAERVAIVQAQAQAKGQLADLEKSLADSGQTDLKAAVEKTGEQAALLRRRVQLEDRLDRMSRHRADLEEQSHELLEKQILPTWILASLGGVFVLGVLMLLAGLFLPSVPGGWPLALLGLLAFGAAAAAKWFLENAVAQNLEATRKQLTLLDAQTQQANNERDALDAELPAGGGSLTSRLQTAEAALAKLEQLMPLEAQRGAADQTVQSADHRATQARDTLKAAHRRWQAALVAAGLSPKFTPSQIAQLIRHHSGRAKSEQQLREAREERDKRIRELTSLTSRIEPLFLDAGVKPDSPRASEQLRQLRRLVTEQESLIGKRDGLVKKQRHYRRLKIKTARALRRLERHRLGLLRFAQVVDEAEFVRRATERAQLDELHRRRELLDREVATACAGVCSEADVSLLLAPAARQHLSEQRTQMSQRLHGARATLGSLFEQRGQFNEQLKHLSDDGRIGRRRLELGIVQQRLAEAIHNWQVLAVTGSLLHSIRLHYERERQPETLREASVYLSRLTAGRYTRVWTPMEEDILRVDDASGATLPVEVLSRGTREQLFLSLRLALANSYGKRGATMPLVLDDVLVNFDEDRAKLAAETLCDFAAAGHQMLLFTCHEHLAAMFKRLGADVRRLPSNSDLGDLPEPQWTAPLQLPPEAQEFEPPRRRKPRATKPPMAEPAIVEFDPPVLIEQEEPIYVAPPDATPVTTVISPPLAVKFPEPFPAAEPIVADLLPPEPVELAPRRALARRHRADLPHRRAAMRGMRHRWSAEEFDGELEDRVATPPQRTDDDQTASYEI